MAHYLLTFNESDYWGDRRHRFKVQSEGENAFENEVYRKPLVRLLRWDNFHLTELRRGEVFREVEPKGYIGHFPNSYDEHEEAAG